LILTIAVAAAALVAPCAAGNAPGTIAYTHQSDLWTVDGNGNNARLLIAGPGITDPQWSPDGTKIAYAQECRLHVANADGSGVTALPKQSRCDGNPTWSADGRRLAFEATVYQTVARMAVAIAAVNVDGTGFQRIT